MFFKIFTRLALIVSSIMLIYFFSLISLFELVPWDTTMIRPEIGTWQRTINDFFEGRLGENLLILFFCIMIALPVFKTLTQPRKILLRGLVINILCLILGISIFIFSSNLIYIIFPYDNVNYTDPFFHNYTRSIIPLTVYGVIYSLWLSQIMKLHKPIYKQKNKLKNSLTEPSTNRLIDYKTDDTMVNHKDNHVKSEYFTAQ